MMNANSSESSATTNESQWHPFVYEEADSKSLHFTIDQLQSRMRTSAPNRLELDYTRTMMGFLVLHRHPRHIAMIGLGGGSLAKFCRHHLPYVNFTAVEINPHIIALRREFLIPDDGDGFRIIQADGADFVRGVVGSIDVLMVDGFDHRGQPAQLCSLKFYQDCKQALSHNGVLVINFHKAHPLYGLFIDHLNQTFDGHVAEVSANHDSNAVVFASRQLQMPAVALRMEIAVATRDWAGWIAQHA